MRTTDNASKGDLAFFGGHHGGAREDHRGRYKTGSLGRNGLLWVGTGLKKHLALFNIFIAIND